MTTELGARDRPLAAGEDRAPLRRYEMWVRNVLSPAIVASFPVRAQATALPRRSRIRRLQVRGDRDLTRVVRRLAECGVEVVELRAIDRCA